MGAYDGKHSLHYICSDCRIGFKSMQKSLVCPHCNTGMIEMSVCFRIPRKKDKKAWVKVKREILHGNRFENIWWAR